MLVAETRNYFDVLCNNSVAIQSDLKFTTITQYANLMHHGGIEGSDGLEDITTTRSESQSKQHPKHSIATSVYRRDPAKNDKMVDIATWNHIHSDIDRNIWKNSPQFSLVNITVEMIGLHDITAQNVVPTVNV